MLRDISNFFNKHLASDTEQAETSKVDKIHLASAALLIELSKADQSIDEEESKALLKILQDKFELPEDKLLELYQLAEAEAEEATSLYQFTNLINEHYDRPSKIRLIQDMWEIAYADGKVDRHEDYLIRKVSELIYVSHSDFIKTKLAVKNSLE